MLTVTVAVFDVAPTVSCTVYVKLSLVKDPTKGEYVTVPSPLLTTVPFEGPVPMATVVGSTTLTGASGS